MSEIRRIEKELATLVALAKAAPSLLLLATICELQLKVIDDLAVRLEAVEGRENR